MDVAWFIMLLLIAGLSLLYSIEAFIKRFFRFQHAILFIIGVISTIGAISLLLLWV
jgi:hypothetical protein